ncbi:hypothetical protein DCS_07387 [Drechmeria coniospora]|uniref:Uncharacterized protein n=1 Tax=Drechmeria coniospora TaxID=98403 RepID=A0A151GEA3_DRECN|nr:hypothetical protein DCS_07387 [Drechmeria coniospora]KYK55424.1 hypothetical protein DCS_07387 [Drechmeria coniospora]ODA81968.2 hypothetical protein RJ55_00473 [Drechmeria coniospora]
MPHQRPNLSVSTSRSDQSPIPPPPVSPITPTLPTSRLPEPYADAVRVDTAGAVPPVEATNPLPLFPPLHPPPPMRPTFSRPTYSHASHLPQAASIPPPPPEPIDFDANPDVLALKSAISVLQVQRKRAAADILALHKAKEDALEAPDDFVKDLAAGKVRSRGDEARLAAAWDDEGDADADEDDEGGKANNPRRKEWTSLPQAQKVVRCPPVNWSQYAVVGDSLDKLHAEQISCPTQGTPASIGRNATYEFKGDGKQEKYAGVAAPYAPGVDRIAKKVKGKR